MHPYRLHVGAALQDPYRAFYGLLKGIFQGYCHKQILISVQYKGAIWDSNLA